MWQEHDVLKSRETTTTISPGDFDPSFAVLTGGGLGPCEGCGERREVASLGVRNKTGYERWIK